MKLQKQLLEAVEHKQLRPLDVQFALTVAGDEHPAVTLAAALLSPRRRRRACLFTALTTGK